MVLLVELPPEILELILHRLDPNSLFLASLTCQTVRSSIFSTKTLLNHHLTLVPGHPVDQSVEDTPLTVTALGNVLTTRLQNTLLRGVNILADRTSCRFTQRHSAKASIFETCRGCSKDHCLLVLVDAFDARIDVYFVSRDDTLVFCYSLGPELLATYLGLEASDRYKLEILKVATPAKSHKVNPHQKPTSTLIVLCRYSIRKDRENSFVVSAARRSRCILKLVRFDGDCVSAVRNVHVEKRDEVMGLAADEKGKTAVIAIRTLLGSQEILIVSLAECRENGTHDRLASVRVRELGPGEKPLECRITDLQIRAEKVLLFSSFPVAEWYTELNDARSRLSQMQDMLSDEQSEFTPFTCGASFATEHRCHWKDFGDDMEYCLNTSLYLGMKLKDQKGAYIVKGVHYPGGCTSLKVGTFAEDTVNAAVAKLEGYDSLTQTSIGPILAISRGGTRIAIAVWKRLLIWAINPQAFLRPDEDPTVDVEAMDAAGDPGYTEACGHSFYRAYDRVGNVTILPPVELKNDAVVHKLAFVDEDILYGLTDQGLVSWDMRAGCAGRQIMDTVNRKAGVDVRMEE